MKVYTTPEKPFVLNSQLFEPFRAVHYDEYKAKNRAEQLIIEQVKSFVQSPLKQTLPEIREMIINILKQYPVSYGELIVGEINVSSSIIGHKNWVERQFDITAKGREMPSLMIKETLTKDSENNYELVPPEQLVYNRQVEYYN